jgi:signal transduction histidine kinase
VREPVDLDEVFEGVARDMGALAASRGVSLTAECAAGTVDGDAQRLRQLGAILVDNALKFTPKGGRVSIRASRHGSRAFVSVSDTGPGIPQEHLHRVFDRFYRADEARGPGGGTGLGLAIARWIAEAHGGRISVESPPGNGATFTVRLPAGHGSRAEPHVEAASGG